MRMVTVGLLFIPQCGLKEISQEAEGCSVCLGVCLGSWSSWTDVRVLAVFSERFG